MLCVCVLRESTATSSDDRRKEDFGTCLSLFQDTLDTGMNCSAEDIKIVLHVGRSDDANNDRYRSVEWNFNNTQLKINLWGSCFN